MLDNSAIYLYNIMYLCTYILVVNRGVALRARLFRLYGERQLVSLEHVCG